MGRKFDQCAIVPWFSTSFGALHMMEVTDMCVCMCDIIPCSDTGIRTAAAERR